MSEWKIGEIYEVKEKIKTSLNVFEVGEKLRLYKIKGEVLFQFGRIGKKEEFFITSSPGEYMKPCKENHESKKEQEMIEVGTKVKKQNILLSENELASIGLNLSDWNKLSEELTVKRKYKEGQREILEFEENCLVWYAKWFRISEKTEKEQENVMKPKFKIGDEVCVVETDSKWICEETKERIGKQAKVKQWFKIQKPEKNENQNFEYQIEFLDGVKVWVFESWIDFMKNKEETKKKYGRLISVDNEMMHEKYRNQIAEILYEETNSLDESLYSKVKFEDGYVTTFLSWRLEILEDWNPNQNNFKEGEQIKFLQTTNHYKKDDVAKIILVLSEKELLTVETEQGIFLPVSFSDVRKVTKEEIRKQESQKLKMEFQQKLECCEQQLKKLYQSQIDCLSENSVKHSLEFSSEKHIEIATLHQQIVFYGEILNSEKDCFVDAILTNLKGFQKNLESEICSQCSQDSVTLRLFGESSKVLKNLISSYSYLKEKYPQQ